MIDFKHSLNDSQKKAVETIYGPVLVIAGAGSGKTRVIEYRALHLVESGIKPEEILLLTFTRRASQEMLSRASRHKEECGNIDGGTFHSFGYKVLKMYGSRIGLHSSFVLLDETDAENAVAGCVEKLGLLKGLKKAPKKSTLRSILSSSFNKEKPIIEVVEEYTGLGDYIEDLEKLKEGYAAYKKEMGYVDYDDILAHTRDLLKIDDVRKKIASRYKFIMVDEFQDTNRIQGDITYFLAKENGNIMAVGDDAQSIYGFRGACHENILEFPKWFPKCTFIKLERNYRSTQKILDLANSVLRTMEEKFAKTLEAAKGDAGFMPKVLYFKTAYEEAEWIAHAIKEKESNGEKLRSQAVLFRSSYISIPLQAQLARMGIKYKMFGGIKFYEFSHIKDILSHVKVVLNYKDELSWKRVLMLLEGVGAKTAHDIFLKIKSAESFEEAVKMLEEFGAKKGRSDVQMLCASLLSAKIEGKTIFEIVNTITEYYIPLLQLTYEDWKTRINDIHILKELSMSYDSLQDFAADITIDAMGKTEVENTEDFLTLSTIHSAKGLEWDSVFLIGVAEGILPSGMSIGKQKEIEEEKRLFYVAVTRAKKELTMSFHRKSANAFIPSYELSRFISHPDVMYKVSEERFYDWEGEGDNIEVDEDGIQY